MPKSPPSSLTHVSCFLKKLGPSGMNNLNFPLPPYLSEAKPRVINLCVSESRFFFNIHPRNLWASLLSSAAKLLKRRAAQSCLHSSPPTHPLTGSQASTSPTLARGQTSPHCQTSDTEGHGLCSTQPGGGPLSPRCGLHWPQGHFPSPSHSF